MTAEDAELTRAEAETLVTAPTRTLYFHDEGFPVPGGLDELNVILNGGVTESRSVDPSQWRKDLQIRTAEELASAREGFGSQSVWENSYGVHPARATLPSGFPDYSYKPE